MTKTCPICGRMPTEQFTPFCCARCAQVDLGRWLGERYVVETQEESDVNIETNKE